MNNQKVLICCDTSRKLHSMNWTTGWIKFCKNNNIEYSVVDLFRTDAIASLKGYNVLLWHMGNYSFEEMLEARSILESASLMGLKVFPNHNEAWHFDDKVAEMYVLQAVNAPIPESRVFYYLPEVKKALNKNEISFPVVAKLRTGSGSHNVKLLKNRRQLLSYARRMFGKGYRPSPSVIYKTSSNIRSSHSWATFKAKAKRIPEFILTMKGARKFPNEKGYVYLQEFIPNDNFDIKVIILGDKCTGFHRPVRSHDFRASGGGECIDDARSIFTEQIVKSAFATADALGMRCVGFDYVIDKRTGEGKIIEMSYGSAHDLSGAGGYYDRNYNWIAEPIRIEDEIMKILLAENLIKR